MDTLQKLDNVKLYAISIGVVVVIVSLVLYFTSFRFAKTETRISLPNIVAKGRGDIPACVKCHGEKGQGNDETGVPRLASLNAEYINKQLLDYSKQRRQLPDILKEPYTPSRLDAVMSELASQLSSKEKKEIALYYSNLPFTYKPLSFESSRIAKGEVIVRMGKPAQGVPACIHCHGDQLQGFGAEFPPLIGQPAKYLVKQLNDWRAGLRQNDALGIMRNIANQLDDEDVLSVVAYISSIPISGKQQ